MLSYLKSAWGAPSPRHRKRQSPVNALPADIARHILTLVDFHGLQTLQHVSRAWRHLTSEEWLWQTLSGEVYGVLERPAHDATWRALFERLYRLQTEWIGQDCHPEYHPYPMGWKIMTPVSGGKASTWTGHCYWWYFKPYHGPLMRDPCITSCQGSWEPGEPSKIQFTEQCVLQGGEAVETGGGYTGLHLDNCILGHKTYESNPASFFVVMAECTPDATLVHRLLMRLPDTGLQWRGTVSMHVPDFLPIALHIGSAQPQPCADACAGCGACKACAVCGAHRQPVSVGQVTLQLGMQTMRLGRGQLVHEGDRVLQQWDTHPEVPPCRTLLQCGTGCSKLVAQVRGKFLFGTLGNTFTFRMKLRQPVL